MQPQKKILILVTRAELGGAQNHIVSLIKGLNQHYHFILGTGTKGQLNADLDSLGITTYIIPSLDKKQFFRSAIGLANIIIKEQPALVHTHSAVASFIGRIVSKLLRKKTLYTVHGWHFVPNAVPLRRFIGPILELIARPFTDYWITVSQYDKTLGAEKRALVVDKCTVIENGVIDTSINNDINSGMNSNSELKAKRVLTSNSLKVAFIGRATYQKNCLAALNIIDRCDPRVSLTFFSANGDHLPSLRSAIVDKKLTSRVALVEDEYSAGECLEKFDVLLMTSLYEGMPLCGLEAMRAGLPIITSDVCGLREIVAHGKSGFVFDLQDSKAAVTYINTLLEDPKQRATMGELSRSMYEETHLEQHMVDKTYEVYEKLCGS